MGLPIHGSQNMNHIRLIKIFNYVKARYDYLLSLSRVRRNSMFCDNRRNMRRFDANYLYSSKFNSLKLRAKNNNAYKTTRYKQQREHSVNVHKNMLSLPLKPTATYHSSHYHHMIHKPNLSSRRAFPFLSNMPFIHLNSSLILINSSPFALTDRRFGILHHHSPSISYY